MGDFNRHSIVWGYLDTAQNGEKVEGWAKFVSLFLVYDPQLFSSFNSGRWKKGYNLTIIFVRA